MALTRTQIREGIAFYIKDHPEQPIKVIADKLGWSNGSMYFLMKQYGITRRPVLDESILSKLGINVAELKRGN